MEITSFDQLDLSKSYNYLDYLNWKFQERVELFKGKVLKMSPAPSRNHQKILNLINYRLYNFLLEKTCEVYVAPFDVRLEKTTELKDSTTVVQPDICVICDLEKLDERGCNGAPELIVEILSPGNSKKEMKQKFNLYEEAGVLEYWIVVPENKTVFQYINENGQFINKRPLIAEDILKSKIIPNFELDLSEVFPN